MSTDRSQPTPVPPPSRHQLALMIWLAVLPTLTVLNLALSSLLADVSTVPRTFVLATIPVATARRRAQLAPPASGQPGPFSLGPPGVLEQNFRQASFEGVGTHLLRASLRLPRAADCIRFLRESAGALHQMISGLPPAERDETWQEIHRELSRFEGPNGFAGP